MFGVVGIYTAAEEWRYIAEYLCMLLVHKMNCCYAIGLKIQEYNTLETSDVAAHLKQDCLHPQAGQQNTFYGSS